MGEETVSGKIVRHLHELKDALESVGFATKIAHPKTASPYLQATNPNATQLRETICCSHHTPNGDALWFFWS